jgi:hypothetical protein
VYKKGSGLIPLRFIKVGMPSKELIRQYEEKKTEFTTKLNKNITRDLEKIDGIERKAKPLTEQQKEIMELLLKKKNMVEIAQIMNRHQTLIRLQMNNIRKKGIEIIPITHKTKITHYEIKGYDTT